MKSITLFLTVILFSSCIPDTLKEKMNDGMAQAQTMMADQQFKSAIAQVELHKLRNGAYPNSLSELQFLSAMDSSMFHSIKYTRLDTAYEMNIDLDVPSFDGKSKKRINLTYPPEFWKGLGCIKSNAKGTMRNSR
jgi:hypothetical protein